MPPAFVCNKHYNSSRDSGRFGTVAPAYSVHKGPTDLPAYIHDQCVKYECMKLGSAENRLTNWHTSVVIMGACA